MLGQRTKPVRSAQRTAVERTSRRWSDHITFALIARSPKLKAITDAGWRDDLSIRDNLSIGSIRRREGDAAMVTLKAEHLANLILQMLQQEAELRRFAEPIKL